MMRRRASLIAVPALVVLLAVLPQLVTVTQVLILTGCLVYAIFALAFYLLLAYTGMVSFGHAAFLGAGAYTVAVLTIKMGLGVAWAFVLAPVACALIACFIGALSIRLSALYFSMLTLAFGQFLWALVEKVNYFGGDSGLIGVPSGFVGISPTRQYYIAAVLMLGVLAVVVVIGRSPFGLVLRATRSNATRASFVGVNVPRMRIAAFVISGALAGIPGALLAIINMTVSPVLGFWTQSGQVLVMVLLGGLGTAFGPIVGAFAFTYGQHYIANATTTYWQIVLGALLIALVLFLPDGLTGGVSTVVRRLVDRPRRLPQPASDVAANS